MATPLWNHYYLGQKVRVTGTFTDINGNAADPSAVYFSYKITSSGDVTT